jgi:hypothetical protein
MKNIILTDSQVQTLIAALNVSIEESPYRFIRMQHDFKLYDNDSIKRIERSMERENESRKQILELLLRL